MTSVHTSSLQGDAHFKTLYLRYMFTVSRVTAPDTVPGLTDPPFQGDYTTPYHAPGVMHPQSQGNPTSQTAQLGSHVHSFQVNPPPQSLYLGSHVYSLQSDPSLQTLSLGSHVHGLQGDTPPRTCTWGHMATVSRVNPYQTLCPRSHVESPGLPASQTLHLGSHVRSLQCDPTPAPVVTCPDSRVTPSQTLHLG